MILYYGNGICSVEGGVEDMAIMITYNGAIEINDLTPNGYAITAKNNKIVIFPYQGVTLALGELFRYVGTLRILSAEVYDLNGKINIRISKVMDYSELLYSKAEDMTTVSEDLKAEYTYVKKIKKTVLKQKIIPNLYASEGSSLYLPDDTIYIGDYHIHLETSTAMTGKSHTGSSVLLSRGLIAIKEHCHCIGAIGPEHDTPQDTYQNIIHGVCPTYTNEHECAGAFLPGTDDEDASIVACIWYCGTQSPLGVHGRTPYIPSRGAWIGNYLGGRPSGASGDNVTPSRALKKHPKEIADKGKY